MFSSLDNPSTSIPKYNVDATNISSGFVALKKGFCWITKRGSGGNDASLAVYVNGKVIVNGVASYASGSVCAYFPVNSGDVVTWSWGGGSTANARYMGV